MVEGFSRYIAVGHKVSYKRRKCEAGKWPVISRDENPMPIHLYQKGPTLIWGGHGVNENGDYLKDIGEEHHQVVHSDYGDLPFGGEFNFKPMNGMSHPCTYNTPIEDYREIETFNVEEGSVVKPEKEWQGLAYQQK
jgi:hypothetical protein